MSQTTNTTTLIKSVAALVKTELAPLTNAIDQEGLYPADFLHKLGALGGFASAIPKAYGGLELGLDSQIDITSLVGRECGSTAFLTWCQSTCAWYLLHAPNETVRARYLPQVAQGKLLAGTGMSNTVKHLAGIEKIHLSAVREGDGYIVSGSLPWVSNIGKDHLAIVAASVGEEGYIMFAVRGDTEGLSLNPCPEFSGLEGTQTLNMRFRNVRIQADDVLAQPDQFKSFIARIKAGFVLGQLGMGFGIIEGSLKTIRESNVTTSHVNVYLDEQGEDIAATFEALRNQVSSLAPQAENGTALILDILRARANGSEATLAAAQSALLHAGAKGYLMRHPAQRRLREAIFVAIVTPALKHLRKEIHDIEQAQQAKAEAA